MTQPVPASGPQGIPGQRAIGVVSTEGRGAARDIPAPSVTAVSSAARRPLPIFVDPREAATDPEPFRPGHDPYRFPHGAGAPHAFISEAFLAQSLAQQGFHDGAERGDPSGRDEPSIPASQFRLASEAYLARRDSTARMFFGFSGIDLRV